LFFKLVVSQDPFVVAVMPKGGIEVKLANVRRCSQMFFTLVIVNYQKKRDKRTNNVLQNITQKTNDRATCICNVFEIDRFGCQRAQAFLFLLVLFCFLFFLFCFLLVSFESLLFSYPLPRYDSLLTPTFLSTSKAWLSPL
jgi:hypothetical protein